MKLLIVCPIPVEYNACRQTFGLRDTTPVGGCKTGRASVQKNEIRVIETGPAKIRTASATAFAACQYQPDLIVDSGTCAGLEPGGRIGEIILSGECFEYDIAGKGIPDRFIPEMRLPSALNFLSSEGREHLHRQAVAQGEMADIGLRIGAQACGEHLVQSLKVRQKLFSLFHVLGANWETAAVYTAALRLKTPAISIRIVTDLGDERALADFRRNVKTKAKNLYQYIQVLVNVGWFEDVLDQWSDLSEQTLLSLPDSIRP